MPLGDSVQALEIFLWTQSASCLEGGGLVGVRRFWTQAQAWHTKAPCSNLERGHHEDFWPFAAHVRAQLLMSELQASE